MHTPVGSDDRINRFVSSFEGTTFTCTGSTSPPSARMHPSARAHLRDHPRDEMGRVSLPH